MFPVRSTIVRTVDPRQGYFPGVEGWYGLGDTAAAQERLKKDIKSIAIKSAAANLGLQIGLLFVPVVGWAAAAIVSLVQFFVGKRYEKKTKEVIEKTGAEIKAYADRAQSDVQALASKIYEEELPAAQALALSNQSLDGFFDAIKKGVKDVHKVVTRVAVKPARVVVKGTLHAVGSAAGAVGMKSVKKDLYKVADKGDKIAADIQSRLEDPQKALNLITGKETYETARRRAAELKTAAVKQIDNEKAEAVKRLSSPEYRLSVRVATAKALRGSPDFQQAAANLAAQEAAQRAALQQALDQERQAIASMRPDPTLVPPPAAGKGALIGGGLAAAAATAFFLR